MTTQEILASLENFSESFPREALEEVRSKRVDITAELLESLDYANQNAAKLYEESIDNFLHIYAMYLLAEFREKNAFLKLIALLHLPEDHIDFILGDGLTEDFPRLLCSTFDGENIKALTDVIEHHELYAYARSAAMRAYVLLYKEGFIAEEEIISYFRYLIHTKLAADEPDMSTSLVNCIIEAKLTQMIPDVRYLYDHGNVDASVCGQYDSFLDILLSDHDYLKKGGFIGNSVQEMEWWACFKNNHQEQSDKNLIKGLGEMIQAGVREDRKLNQAIVQKTKKVGRNDPCPYGSGKKYKRCCYNKLQQENRPLTPVRLENKYDLLVDYPKESPMFKSLFDEEAIEIDIPVYKALHHRAIPMWVQRDYEQENIDKIYYLEEALKLFLDKCQRERIHSFTEYDEKYMVHYRSSHWVERLANLGRRFSNDPQENRLSSKVFFSISCFSSGFNNTSAKILYPVIFRIRIRIFLIFTHRLFMHFLVFFIIRVKAFQHILHL